MTSLMYIFPWRQLEWTGRTSHFDVASSPFKYHFGALMWPPITLKKSSWT